MKRNLIEFVAGAAIVVLAIAGLTFAVEAIVFLMGGPR